MVPMLRTTSPGRPWAYRRMGLVPNILDGERGVRSSLLAANATRKQGEKRKGDRSSKTGAKSIHGPNYAVAGPSAESPDSSGGGEHRRQAEGAGGNVPVIPSMSEGSVSRNPPDCTASADQRQIARKFRPANRFMSEAWPSGHHIQRHGSSATRMPEIRLSNWLTPGACSAEKEPAVRH